MNKFIRKYIACYRAQPEDDVLLRPVDVGARDKYVTSYKNFYISGWMGTYCLNGQRKYLDFMFQAGLGNRNSPIGPMVTGAAVLCQGEFCLAFSVISKLQQSGVTVLAACSERNVKSEDNGRKITVFEFKRFRKY